MAIGTQRVIGTTIGHCGYDFPWDPSELLPFRSSTRYHDYHHEGNINGNFGGGTYLIDWILGYNTQYFRHLDKLESLKKDAADAKRSEKGKRD
jgi:sterol desaturase/sphingolipid hydroxylase (fatty acid hydroxylase superfamily)